jgi:predicted enzyme related to lactoylglutathione lyase
MTWNDLVTPDPDAAASFYGALFGWTFEEIPDAGGYRVIRNGERSNGGVMPLDPERMGPETPPSWMPYFGHEDVDRLVGEIGSMGGQVFNGPMRMPQGAVAILGDPQGAVFAVWTGQYGTDRPRAPGRRPQPTAGPGRLRRQRSAGARSGDSASRRCSTASVACRAVSR